MPERGSMLLAGNSGPSDAAVDAAMRRADPVGAEIGRARARLLPGYRKALEGAHDPALGLDRSVCLRDVVDWLREEYANVAGLDPAAEVEREFGGKG